MQIKINTVAKKRESVADINERLKAARTGLTIIQRGDRLSLRGTFPPKPGSGKHQSHQQTISLGVYANPAGLQFAEQKAKEWGALLAQQRFSWLAIASETGDGDKAGKWIELFKKKLKADSTEPDQQFEAKFRHDYTNVCLSLLPPDAVLTEKLMRDALRQIKPNSRRRQMACIRMKAFAKFCGISADFSDLIGNYDRRAVKRTIPTDEQIEEAIDGIKNPHWQYVAAMMATYGLRNHEVWYARLYEETRDGKSAIVCDVKRGKTGARQAIAPMHPRWVERWNLTEGSPPDVQVVTNRGYGVHCANYFKDSKRLPFELYSLRHAYAIRGSLVYGFPPAVMALWLGHSPVTYLRTYQRHISESQAIDAFLDRLRGN